MNIVIKMGINTGAKWSNFLLPRRLTLRSSPPVYKWLFWWFTFEDKRKQGDASLVEWKQFFKQFSQ